VRAVARSAQLSDAALDRGLEIATASPDARAWRMFLSQALLLLGAGLVLSGVISFVAYNWARVGRFGKFAVIEIAIIAAALFAWKKLPKLIGEVALFAAAVLVGGLLAVFGQTYQTGADPYGLFSTWLLIILPWVVAARWSATWVLALLLLDTSIALYWSQVIGTQGTADFLWVPVTIGAIHFVALAAWELQRWRKEPWLTERWAQRLVAVFALYAWWLAAVVTVINVERAGVAGTAGFVAFVAAVATMLRHYRRPLDLFMMTIAMVAAMALGTTVAFRLMVELLSVGFFILFVMAAVVVWEITLLMKWYRRMRDAS
jgi:uncharacterized membrane protein